MENLQEAMKCGYSPFAIDITDIAVNGNNTIVVRAEDYPDACQPRENRHGLVKALPAGIHL